MTPVLAQPGRAVRHRLALAMGERSRHVPVETGALASGLAITMGECSRHGQSRLYIVVVGF